MEAAVRAYQNVTQKEFRDQLVVEHLDSVRHVLGRVVGGLPGFVDVENLESAGILGLVEAAAQFDPSRGVEFITFAYHRIRGAMLDELRRNCPLPQSILQQWSLIRSAWNSLGEHAPVATVAELTGLTEEEVESCITAVRVAQPESWHEEMADWKSSRSRQLDPTQSLDAEDEQRLLANAIEQLPERLRVVLSLYYTEELRLAEIGEVLSLSESRVSRLLTKAQLQLKSILERTAAK
ncbi:sigma-70 family RNA polymerase sigma factor [Planctomicrobium sp. SH661]|uniref:sigma-70 family RNA polymerase sigma factor n=1 Tax=Planctomicrobium sp. SH661 TaxID=3448124 RepID=UPI003F5BE035